MPNLGDDIAAVLQAKGAGWSGLASTRETGGKGWAAQAGAQSSGRFEADMTDQNTNAWALPLRALFQDVWNANKWKDTREEKNN